MAWPFRRRAAIETKAHPNGAAFVVPGGAQWARSSGRKQYIDEGYQLNVIVYRAITEIVRAAGAVKIELYRGDDAITSHPLLNLLDNPAPLMTWQDWLTEMMVNRMLFGEMASIAAGGGTPAELWPINPLHVIVKPGANGIPLAYVHEHNNRKVRFEVDQITGQSDMLFSKTYNPNDYWRGQSPLMAAALAADTHNSGMRWNFSLLKNSARPSGVVRFKGQYPGGETIARMREYFKAKMQGSDNAGEIPMLADDAEWVALSQTARDMDFLNVMKETSKYVASALGVPLPLIDNDASTFNNLEQAKERLYTDTVIPLMEEMLASLNMWLVPRFGDGLELRLDLDTIPALEALRERTFRRAVDAFNAGLMTLEEARELIGYEPTTTGTFKASGFDILPTDAVKSLAYGLDP